MRTKVIALLVLVVACGAVLTGCGSSNKKTSSNSTPAATTAASSTSTPAATTAASSSSTPAATTAASSSSTPSATTSAGSTNSPAAAAAKQACDTAASNPELNPSKRSELSADCQKVADAAASGDQAKFKSAYLAFCGSLASALPSEAQAAAKSACDQGANAIP